MGLATLSAAVQRSGGSQQHPGEKLDDKLEELGAGIEGGAGAEAFGFGFQCLREDAAEVLSLFAEARRPRSLAWAPMRRLPLGLAWLARLGVHAVRCDGLPARCALRDMLGRTQPAARV